MYLDGMILRIQKRQATLPESRNFAGKKESCCLKIFRLLIFGESNKGQDCGSLRLQLVCGTYLAFLAKKNV